jgi:hypothetical protein
MFVGKDRVMGFIRNAGPPKQDRVIYISEKLVCEDGDRTKTVMMTVFENARGRAIRITEKAGSRFTSIIIPVNQSRRTDDKLCTAFDDVLSAAFGRDEKTGA